MKKTLLDLEKRRRTIYGLGRHLNVDQNQLAQFIFDSIKWTPSPFNNQTTRAVVLFNKQHEKLWDIVADVLKNKIGDERFEKGTKAKIDSFRNAYGSVLFFTDTSIVDDFKKKFPSFAGNFRDWSEQAQGNAQYAVWTGLAENGIGANLQHYNPIIDDKVAKAFDIPSNWNLRGQMNFGSIEQPAGDKSFMDDSKRFKVLK
ncbi:oxidoreductase [Philodulcilactobacillus myokoensis]|uniref:Oxidoreductase n=1 Tax=Philodulcilactobacillus myokoensis TaxID=2929573 RepID=A0A9W6B091_9LACO|nr:nitroreductase family protein [Philodulcilactobacillus myokoensis]GLB46452.1 oxidoreductase [Philodulcilactobacillus myokoensis]